MAVLFILFGSLLTFRLLGALGLETFATWVASTRWALAVMLLVTASAHFTRMKKDLGRMMPDWVPWPTAVIYFTGVCEVAGALGLLVPSVRRLAGMALVVFFIAVFPANMRAARTGATLRGRPATPLWLRLPMQLTFIALTWWSTQ